MKIFGRVLPVAIALALPSAILALGFPAQELPRTPDACPVRSLLLNFDVYRFGELRGQAPIWKLDQGPAFVFSSGMAIDADGAPNAYNADDTGLDYLFNAGQPGQWDGVVQDEKGDPIIQGPDDPFPGYYISCTSLFDRTKQHRDPARFVDATQIPYVALPRDLAERTGARLGDLAFVFSEQTGRYSYAIFADIGAFGEGSIALAENLAIRSDARRGGTPFGVSYFVFPGSGDGRPKSVVEINRLGGTLLDTWGGPGKTLSCAGIPAEKSSTPIDATDRAASSPSERPTAQGKVPPDAATN